MSVFKRYRGKRIFEGDIDWDKGTWYVYKRVFGQIIHKSLKEAESEKDALRLEQALISKVQRKLAKSSVANFEITLKKPEAKKLNYIYVLESGGYFKIGRTNDIALRLKQISKTIIPFETHVLCVVQIDEAKDFEKEIHSKFSNFRVKGEWFELDKEQVNDLKRWLLEVAFIPNEVD